MRWSVVLLALAVTFPTLYSALWVQNVPIDSAVIHFLIAFAVMSVLDGLVRAAAKPVIAKREVSRAANTSSEATD